MKSNLLAFLLGIAITVSVAATTGITKVSVEAPAQTRVTTFKSRTAEEEMARHINTYVKAGWVVKSVSMSALEIYDRTTTYPVVVGIVVMEKYP